MLCVKTTVKPSSIERLGLFAAEKIPKGTTVWKFDPHFDLMFEESEVKKMDALQQALIGRYAYLSTETGKYVYCTDDARFINHSSKRNNLDTMPFPNESETRAVANRDIEMGEELLVNYRAFDIHDASSTEEYLQT